MSRFRITPHHRPVVPKKRIPGQSPKLARLFPDVRDVIEHAHESIVDASPPRIPGVRTVPESPTNSREQTEEFWREVWRE